MPGASREFRGFSRVTVVDPLGTRTVSYFRQGYTPAGATPDVDQEGEQGMLYRKEVYGGDGSLYTTVVNHVAVISNQGQGSNPPFSAQVFPYVDQSLTWE